MSLKEEIDSIKPDHNNYYVEKKEPKIDHRVRPRPSNFKEQYEKWKRGETSKRQLSIKCDVPLMTLYKNWDKWIKEIESEGV